MKRNLIQKQNPYKHWEFSDLETGNRLRVVPERGGIITEWLCNGVEILYFDLERYLDKGKSIRGGIPILFPICGSLPGNSLYINDNCYSMNQHGFARDSIWDIQPIKNQKGFSLQLSQTDQSLNLYPCFFSINITVQMNINSLEFAIEVYNSSHIEMPFSFGLHPYFNVRDLTRVELHGLPAKGISQKNSNEIESFQIVRELSKGIDCLFEPSGGVSLIDLTNGRGIKLSNEYPMNLNVIWTDPPRKMVCLEPWTSPKESLINGERKLVLPPQNKMELGCKITSF